MAKSETPLVSIVVPVYNGEKYLRESLDSIVNQTYSNIEVLVMDDASTDNSPEIVKIYGDKVTHHRQPTNRGQFDNVNDGIGMASGQYIAVYHADDIYDPRIVELEVKFLQKYPETGAVFCLDIFIDAKGLEYGRLDIPAVVRGEKPIKYPIILNTLLTYKNVFLVGPTSMVRASAYKEVGLYRGEEFQIASDLEMWVRIARKYPIGIIEKHLHRYRHGHSNLSQQFYHLRAETERHFMILDLYLKEGGMEIATEEALSANEAHRAEDMLMVAINHYIIGNIEDSNSFLKKVKFGLLLGSSRVQRGRLLILLLAMKVLVHLPKITLVADLFYRRWHKDKQV